MKFSWAPLLALVSSCAAYHILVSYPAPSRSHSFLGDGIVRSLLAAGHEVTYITPYPKKDPPKLLHQVDVSFMMDTLAAQANILAGAVQGKAVTSISKAMEIIHNSTLTFLKNDAVQGLLKDKSRKFDAVISELLFGPLYGGFAQVFQCPWIVLAPAGMSTLVEYLMDEVQSPATSPHFITGYTVPLTLKERIVNTVITFGSIFSMVFSDQPREEPVYYKYYSPGAEAHGVTLQPYSEAAQNISLAFLNSHPALGEAIRLPPNAVEIGGFYIDPNTKPLPKDLQELLDNSPEGLIYFSMGSNIKSADMTDRMRQDLLRTFGALKQNVLWKFEEELKGVPKNVYIRSWLPQQSLLAHKNMKIFITHGGMLSTTEAIYFGVPLIGLPVYGDQLSNAQRAEKKGYALKLDLQSPELGKNLAKAIEKILGDPSYAQTAQRLSQLFHDRPVPPARLVSYWTEHAVRTGGAPHLRTAASAVPAYQRYLLDVLALLLAALLLLFFLLRALVRWILSRILPENRNKNKYD